MTTALAALLIGVAGAALLLALFTYFWVNRDRTANERFDEYGRVPLFGVDLVAPPSNSAASNAERSAGPADSDSAHDQSGEISTRAVEPDAVSAPPRGQPIAIDNSAIDGSAHPQAEPIDPASTRRPPNPQPRRGWGASPGWPVPEVPTPRYVPPVAGEVRANYPPSPYPTSVPATPSNGNGVVADGIPGSMVEGDRIRFSTPAEGTLQFLPGRLEISSGMDTGREIRFVRVPGPNGTEVTFGRNEGPLYRHIQLRDQTVSREHARMTHIDGRWLLTNLSKTNPVAHNGRILGLGEHQLLDDGDRLEMGEVIFSFRSR